jgi:hypothetical protein
MVQFRRYRKADANKLNLDTKDGLVLTQFIRDRSQSKSSP